MKPQRIQWKVDGSHLKRIQSDKSKDFGSEILGGMWYIGMNKEMTQWGVYIQLCTLSLSNESISVLAEMECILKGEDFDKKIIKSNFDTLTLNDEAILGLSELSTEDICKCQSITFIVNIVLRQWIKNEVKLPQYLNLFIDHGFDMESVKCLTERVLKDMGVDKAGHRLKIMSYVNKMKHSEGPR